MTFTERNCEPYDAAGDAIPNGVRIALLDWFQREHITSDQELWPALRQREGYGTWKEMTDDISRRFGTTAGDRFGKTMEAHLKREQGRRSFVSGYDYNAQAALLALPTPQFLDDLELAIAASPGHRGAWEAIEEVNRLFTKRGISYRIAEGSGLAEWHGDESAHRLILRPVLTSLGDPRLAGAKDEFDAAVAHIRRSTSKDLEDAIEEAAKSVESVMKVLAAGHRVRVTGKETAKPLFDALAAAGVVVREADQAVLGASRLRNEYAGHGTGAQPRAIPPGIPQLALRSAATAIAYLSQLLPE